MSLSFPSPGDTLFALGCGRLFEGDPPTMWSSLSKLVELPRETAVYCAHEYTQSNAKFAVTMEGSNELLQERKKAIDEARSKVGRRMGGGGLRRGAWLGYVGEIGHEWYCLSVGKGRHGGLQGEQGRWMRNERLMSREGEDERRGEWGCREVEVDERREKREVGVRRGK